MYFLLKIWGCHSSNRYVIVYQRVPTVFLRISCVAASHATLTAMSSTEAAWAGLLGHFSCNRQQFRGVVSPGLKGILTGDVEVFFLGGS